MCNTCPDGLCANNGTCDNTKANCKDDASYGPECKDECTKIGPNCLKCNRDETCSVCVNATFYGKKCENFCSHCPNNECNIDGTCVNTDEDCPDPHFYGNDCKKSCKDINGNCDTCSRKEICTNCTTEEYWGNKCEKHCDYCPENRCYINGICVDKNNNCIGSNFTGERCDEPCTDINNNCLFCDRKKICFECKNKSMFGDDCSTPCDRCPGNPSICDNKGICNDTKTPCKDPSYTGLNCSLLCKDQHQKGNCKTCDRNYICTECYNKEFYGEKCETSCENCPGTCDINGICDNNITDCDNTSFTGDSCTYLCKDLYPEKNCKTCHRNNTCTECYNKEFYGEECETSCENCPEHVILMEYVMIMKQIVIIQVLLEIPAQIYVKTYILKKIVKLAIEIIHVQNVIIKNFMEMIVKHLVKTVQEHVILMEYVIIMKQIVIIQVILEINAHIYVKIYIHNKIVKLVIEIIHVQNVMIKNILGKNVKLLVKTAQGMEKMEYVILMEYVLIILLIAIIILLPAQIVQYLVKISIQIVKHAIEMVHAMNA